MGFWSRVGRLFVGKGLEGVEAAEARNPKAMLALRVQQFNEQQAKFNNALAGQAGIVARLDAQIKDGTAQIAAGTARVKQLVALNNDADRSKAALLAGQVAEQQKHLDENKVQREASNEQFKMLSRQRDEMVRKAKTEIEQVRSMIGDAEMAEARAEMAKMVSSVQFDVDAGGLANLKDSLQKRVANAEGAVRVATESAEQAPWAQSEAERKANDEAALAALLGNVPADKPAA